MSVVLTLRPADVMFHTEENLDVTSYEFWILNREEIMLDFIDKLSVIKRGEEGRRVRFGHVMMGTGPGQV